MMPKDSREIKGRVLRQDELDLIIAKALNQPDKYLTCFLPQLHAGLGPMEIKRLRLDKDVFLDAPVPPYCFVVVMTTKQRTKPGYPLFWVYPR